MTVTVDISPIVYGVGVSRYTANLTRALTTFPDITLRVFGNSLRQKKKLNHFATELGIGKDKRDIHSVSPKMLSLLWYRFGHPSFEFFSQQTDVFHSWEELIPPLKRTPVVATIHDLAWMKYPETAHSSTQYKHAEAWKRLKEHNAHLLAVSQSTKDDILDLMHYPADHVHLVHEALPQESQIEVSESEINEVKKKHHIDKPYIFFIGTREPRKNLDRLIEAWEPLAAEVELVIAGGAGWQKKNTKQTSSLQPKTIGRVSDKELAALYAGAALLAYPSIYEGFGLPLLEAFFHRTPVLTSHVSSMPEIAGDAAVLVNPFDVESIQKGIKQLLQETPEQQKKRQQKMKKQLAKFSWEETARKTIEVYRLAAQDKK